MKADNVFRVMALGDIIGDAGRKILQTRLIHLQRKYVPDLIIANGENAAHGFGITKKIVDELLNWGIDVITGGNHIWQRKEIFDFIDKTPQLLRPLNYPPGTPGHGFYLCEKKGLKIVVVNIMGRIYMEPIDCPFRAMDELLVSLDKEDVLLLVDFHAEATSEKQLMGWYLDGRVHAIWGTHTHIPTADERILPKKTAYISDIGMCGASYSVIGMNVNESVRRVIHHLPVRFSPATEGDLELQGILIDFDKRTKYPLLIQRLSERITQESSS
ncbi:MAG: TIGR00282 family metallophosphoesterase [Brevinematales bacterium]|nr:TIGR00282 family metallophosphoesterase [Brevinematales bacterium]